MFYGIEGSGCLSMSQHNFTLVVENKKVKWCKLLYKHTAYNALLLILQTFYRPQTNTTKLTKNITCRTEVLK